MHIRPIVKYHGGKGRLFQWILSLIPEHETYCEPFGGAASVLLNKKPAPMEIYNDLENTIFNLMVIVRDHFPEFIEEVKNVTYDKETYLKYREIYRSVAFEQLDNLRQATATYVTKRMSRGGLCGTFSWSSRIYSTGPAEVHCWNSALPNLELISQRLQAVQIYNRSAFDVIQEFDRPSTVFYLDPPYLHHTRVSPKVYSCEMSAEDHERLLDLCLGLKGKVLLSGYPSELYTKKMSDWRVSVKDAANHSSHERIKDRMLECIWMNF